MGKFKQLTQATRDFQKGMQILTRTNDIGKISLVLNQLALNMDMNGRVKMANLVLKNAEKDYKKAYKKGGSDRVSQVINESLKKPEFVKLLETLNLSDTHLWLTAETVTGESYVY